MQMPAGWVALERCWVEAPAGQCWHVARVLALSSGIPWGGVLSFTSWGLAWNPWLSSCPFLYNSFLLLFKILLPRILFLAVDPHQSLFLDESQQQELDTKHWAFPRGRMSRGKTRWAGMPAWAPEGYSVGLCFVLPFFAGVNLAPPACLTQQSIYWHIFKFFLDSHKNKLF